MLSPATSSKDVQTQTVVSLPEHLHETLLTLLPLQLPSPLGEELRTFVKLKFGESESEMPYDLLLRISRWAQSSNGLAQLNECSLDTNDFLMISLLSGLITSPTAVLAPYQTPDTNKGSKNAIQERRAVIALINALFSIIGVGVATWWASGTALWNVETRILVSLAAAAIVGASEGTLYFIWTSRGPGPTKKLNKSKKIEPPIFKDKSADIVESEDKDIPGGLRKRTTALKPSNGDTI